MHHKTSTFVCVVIGATLSTARADTDPEAEPAASATAAGEGADQLTLPKGRLLLDAYLEVNVSSGSVFKPFSLSPDVWYGVTDQITVGLTHSGVAASGFVGISPNTALCLAGTGGGCADIYNAFGVDARYRLTTGKLAWAAEGGVYVRDFDPVTVAVKLGAVGRWSSGKLAIELSPNVFIGVTERDAGNEEFLNLPVTALYTVIPKLAAAVQIGITTPFTDLADNYAIPLSIGAHYQAMPGLNVNAAFTLPIVAPGDTGLDVVTLGGTYAF